MAGNDVSIRIGASFVGKKAFKEADSAAAKLTGTVKKLAGGLGLALGARQIAIYGKNAVKAFAADEKAARSLTLTLNNLGLAFADPEVKNFISSLESQFGVLDDQLRPAYQKLLTTTGDYKKAQDLLKTSLDLAAMSGSDVVSVAGDLSKAFAGNTRGLQKYGLGLSKAEIQAMSFEDILKQIAIVSAGQAQSAADSYSGALDRLTVAAANASESIGKDLLTALDTVAGGNGLPKTINLIESLSSGIGDAVIGLSRLIRNIGILASGNPLESIRDLRAATQKDRLTDAKERAQYGGIYADIYKAQAASLASTKKSLTVAKALTKETAAQLKAKQLQAAIDKANAALGKGQEIFDMDKIQIAAALTSQAEQLAKATTSTQQLQIANDVARLRVKQDILALEDAIASQDQKAIEAATAKLNADLKVLSVLTGQNVKLADIKSILDSLKPKDLINQQNLDDALAKIKEMLDLLAKANAAATSKVPNSGTLGSGIPVGDYIAPVSMKDALAASTDSLIEYADAAAARANAFADLLDLQNAADMAALLSSGLLTNGGGNPAALQSFRTAESATINIYANTIANPDELTNLIQDSIIKLNRRGDSLTQAGAL